MISVVFEEPRDEVFEETFPQSHWARVTKVLPHRRNKGPPKQPSFSTLVVLNLFPCAPPKNNKTEAKNWVLFSMLGSLSERGLESSFCVAVGLIEVCG